MRWIITWSAVALLSLTACTAAGSPDGSPSTPPGSVSPSAAPIAGGNAYRLVTLGDSYTAGKGVERRESWPRQLDRVLDDRVGMRVAANLADFSKTSRDVLEDQVPQLDAWQPDVVTLLVGVNDIIAREITLDMYRDNIAAILDLLLEDLPADRIFVITTPDLTLTSSGGDWDVRGEDIAEANEILTTEAEMRGITVVDITPVSDRVPYDASLVAEGGLPSAKQYAGWVELIAAKMEPGLLGRQP